MRIGTVIAIYFLIWWVVLFAVWPWGVRNQQEAGEVVPGTDPGAPAIHRLWSKALWTTVISAIIFAISWLAYSAGLLNVERLTKLMGFPF